MSSYLFQGDKRFWTPRDAEDNRLIFSAQKQETGIKMPDDCKSIYLEVPGVNHGVDKWSLDLIMRLLRFYSGHRCLWDVSDEDNRNRMHRKAALVDIAAAMGGGITRAQVARKINVLRATYRYERRRIKQRIRKGIGPKTKLKWFALADSFLREVPKICKGHRRQENIDDDSDLDNEMVLTIDPQVLMPIESEEQEADEVSGPFYMDDKLIQLSGDIKTDEDNADYRNDTMAESCLDSTYAKPKWTTNHSQKFVKILKTQPVLWSESEFAKVEELEKALEYVAKELNLSVLQVRKRVKKFKKICFDELAKIQCTPEYRPEYVWWPIAESFMGTSETHLKVDNFVDANAASPIMSISYDNEYASPASNPIPSVSTPYIMGIETEENYEELFPTASSTDDIEKQNQTSITVPKTKLIWNGLTEDLLEGKWSLKHSVKFLRLYGTHRCLWDLNDPDYRSRELRAAAIEDIAAAMGYGLDAEYVTKKIKIFRITYMQHRKRMLEAIKSGQEPEIQLRWFPLADSFLRPHIGLRSIKEQELEIPQFDYQYVMANLNLIDPELLSDFRDRGIKSSNETTKQRSSSIESDYRTNSITVKSERSDSYNEDLNHIDGNL